MASTALTTQGLTEREASFVRNLARGIPKVMAAKLAGYACADQEPARLLRRRDVAAALQATLREKLNTELVPVALAQLIAIMQNPNTSDNAKVRAIDVTLKAGGLNKPEEDPTDLSAKGLGSIPKASIEKIVAGLHAEMQRYDTDVIINDPFGLSTP